jgi:hypothetical protein
MQLAGATNKYSYSAWQASPFDRTGDALRLLAKEIKMKAPYTAIPLNNDPNFNPKCPPEDEGKYYVYVDGEKHTFASHIGYQTFSFPEYIRLRIDMASLNLPEDHPFYPRDPAVRGHSMFNLIRRKYSEEELQAHRAWLQEHGLTEEDYQAIRQHLQNKLVEQFRRRTVHRLRLRLNLPRAPRPEPARGINHYFKMERMIHECLKKEE